MAGSFVFTVYFLAAILSANHVSCQTNQWNGLSVKMIVVGKTGVGKSTLINNIFGKKLVEVSGGLELQTKTVQVLNKNINGTRVKICDTPGFRDGHDKDYEYSQELVHRCNSPDVVLFCIRMDDTRWTDDYKNTILSLNNALGKSIWNNTVLVLTFADKVDVDKINEIEMIWKEKLSQQLILIDVDKEVADSIPTVMSGNFVDSVSSGIGDWLPKLFLRCLRVSKESGKTALLTIVLHLIEKNYITVKKSYFKEFIPQEGVKVLVVGKTGIGKSTLINNIFGKKLAPTGGKLEAKTKTVEVINDSINGTGVEICDTPGFRDGQEKDDEYRDMIRRNCSNPDVILFCIRMDETRWTDDYKATILGLNNTFSETIWNNTVLVLTFADKDSFNVTREMEWKEKFNEQLVSIDVNEDVANRVPVVMTSASVNKSVGNWLPKLFTSCLRMSREKGKAALLAISIYLIEEAHIKDDEGYFKEFLCDIYYWLEEAGIKLSQMKYLGALFNPVFSFTGWITGYSLEYYCTKSD